MLEQALDVISLHDDVSSQAQEIDVPHALRIDERGSKSRPVAQDLPITVSIVRTPEQLQRVCDLRASAYGARNFQFGSLLTKPEKSDVEAGNIVLMAESKENGEVLGTIRIHTNLFQSVPMESAIAMPPKLKDQLLAEVCRFCIKCNENSAIVRLALFKALYLYCYANQVQYLLCGARKPINKMYKSLGFIPLDGGDQEKWVRVGYAGNIEHSMLVLDVLRVDSLWRESNHRFYDFIRKSYHPDLKIFSNAKDFY